MKRSKPASSKKVGPAPAPECKHATEELIDLKSITWQGKGLYLCPHCKTKEGAKLLVVREIPQCKSDPLTKFDSLFG